MVLKQISFLCTASWSVRFTALPWHFHAWNLASFTKFGETLRKLISANKQHASFCYNRGLSITKLEKINDLKSLRNFFKDIIRVSSLRTITTNWSTVKHLVRSNITAPCHSLHIIGCIHSFIHSRLKQEQLSWHVYPCPPLIPPTSTNPYRVHWNTKETAYSVVTGKWM